MSIDPSARAINPEGGYSALIALFLSCLAALYPMLWHPFLPLIDIPNHIARLAVLADPDGPLSTYYEIDARSVIPNSAIDMIWIATGMTGDPVAFARSTMMVYAVNLILSVMVLSRVVHGRWSVWPAVAGLLVHNGSFLWGFQNFVFTVPFAIYGLALWLWLEDRPVLLRAAVFLPVAAALFLMHLLGFGILAVAALGREVQRVASACPAWRRQVQHGLVSGLPFALPLAWYLHQTLSRPPGPLGTHTDFGGLQHRLRALLSIQWETPLIEQPLLGPVALIILIVLLLCFATLRRKGGARLKIAPVMKGPVTALLILSLLAPSWINGVALVHIRFPFVVVALALAATQWVDLKAPGRAALVFLFTAMIVQKTVLLERFWDFNAADVSALRTILPHIPPGGRLLPLRGPDQEHIRRLWHVQAYATTYQGVFVPTFFQGSHGVRLKPEWQHHAAPAARPVDMRLVLSPRYQWIERADAYWKNYAQKYTHVLLLDPAPKEVIDGTGLSEIASAGRFRLFAIDQ